MRLKRLELFGFKSFADRTVLDFDRSLTGIVGPNGCGKSNVVDAMRWVLGEQRPTSMRGAEMTDVIFKGSSSRPALGLAEVTVVLDNAAGLVEDRGAEISITRRVYRSGEGEYQIDGQRVRLKDLRDMLFDTGLGSRGYSVLEQGRIDAVLSANAIDRRAIFEEAAGISRYRQRRHETQNKLKRVQQDMDRLQDVIGELETRVRSLKIQAGKAERFIEARDEWRDQAYLLYSHQVHALAERRAAASGELSELEGRAAELRELRAASERDLAAREAEQSALTAEVERLGAEASDASGDLRALDERRAQLSARVLAWREDAQSERAHVEELQRKLAERRAELDAAEGERTELSRGVDELEARLREDVQRLRNTQARVQETRGEYEQQNERVLELLHAKTATQNRVHHLEQALEPMAERVARQAERSRDARSALEAARDAAAAAEADLERAELSVRTTEARRTELAGKCDELEPRTQELAQRRAAVELERTRLESRIETLLDREAERSGLESGARALIDAVDAAADGALTGAPRDAEGAGEAGARPPAPALELTGILADHLRTTTRHARALDVLLGERAQALVVGDSRSALEALEWLKATGEGQVRLVLPQGLSHLPAAPAPAAVLADGGIAPRLRDVVEVSEGFEPLADRLLADVVVAPDLAAARELVGRRPDLRCVTVEGELVDAAGAVGGSRDVAHGAVGRRASAAELEQDVARLNAELEELEREERRAREELRVRRAELERLGAELEAARCVLADSRGAGETARARLGDLEETAEVLEAESRDLAREREQLVGELDEAQQRLVDVQAEFEAENATLQAVAERRAELERGREELARRESQSRVDTTRLAEKLEGVRRRTEDLARVCGEAVEEIERVEGLSREHARCADEGEAQFATIDAERERLLTLRGELEKKLEAQRAREREGRRGLDEFRVRIDAVTRELEDLMESSSAAQLRSQRCELEREDVLRRADDELKLSEFELLDDFQPDDELSTEDGLAALAARVADLKRQLERLGSVNLEAVTELEEVAMRLAFLEGQRDDVLGAKSALESTLRKINEESERLFTEAFDEIRDHFRGIFRQLFGGGRADVSLEEGVPVLEAGIEISARPPGREMLPLGLLSGGQRTLTALALLFAVFRSRPSPFCVLDEVDAALDDANIGRFLVLLDTFRAGTQFVLVTHNKGSMAACDCLYGITMETKGVSRHVSVELSDVDDFVPEATGDATKALDARAEVAAHAGEAEPAAAPVDRHTGEPIVELVPEAAAGFEPMEGEAYQEADSDLVEEEAVGPKG